MKNLVIISGILVILSYLYIRISVVANINLNKIKNQDWHKWYAWYPIKYAGEFYWFCQVWRRWDVGTFWFSEESYIYYPADNRKPSKEAIRSHHEFNMWLTSEDTKSLWNTTELTKYESSPEN